MASDHQHITWQRVAVAALVVLASVTGWQFEQATQNSKQLADSVQTLSLQVAQLTEQVREQNLLVASVPATQHRVTVLEGKVTRLEQDVTELKHAH